MNQIDVLRSLDSEWEDGGFFELLRQGEFHEGKAEEILELLAALDFDEAEHISKRAVRLLWYLPLFLGWQRERVREITDNEEALMMFENQVISRLEDLLGVP